MCLLAQKSANTNWLTRLSYWHKIMGGKAARIGIGNYFGFYNTERPHQALGYRTSTELYIIVPFEDSERGVLESLTPVTVNTAGHYLNLAPLLS
jgi:hypothetical protein